MTTGCESYVDSSVCLMVCEQAKFHPHETSAAAQRRTKWAHPSVRPHERSAVAREISTSVRPSVPASTAQLHLCEPQTTASHDSDGLHFALTGYTSLSVGQIHIPKSNRSYGHRPALTVRSVVSYIPRDLTYIVTL